MLNILVYQIDKSRLNLTIKMRNISSKFANKQMIVNIIMRIRLMVNTWKYKIIIKKKIF